MIFPVVFKTLPTKQYAPVREFRRRVRLALEEHNLLPGDPNRIFTTFVAESPDRRGDVAPEDAPVHDPTTLKPQDGNPLSGE